MAENPIKAHLETLVTPEFENSDAKEVMKYLDNMINTYLNETESMMINVVEYGFNNGENENSIVGYVRIAVWLPIKENHNNTTSDDGNSITSNDCDNTSDDTDKTNSDSGKSFQSSVNIESEDNE